MYRIIAYTNNRVATWNNYVRHSIIKDADKSLITSNDLIMSYVTIVNNLMILLLTIVKNISLKILLILLITLMSLKGF